jgi:hypothetical protein
VREILGVSRGDINLEIRVATDCIRDVAVGELWLVFALVKVQNEELDDGRLVLGQVYFCLLRTPKEYKLVIQNSCLERNSVLKYRGIKAHTLPGANCSAQSRKPDRAQKLTCEHYEYRLRR